MRAILVLAIILGALISLSQTAHSFDVSEPAAVEAVNAAGAEVEGSGPLIIPKWRLSVRFLPDYGKTFALGIYRSVGSRYDLGVSISVDADLSERDYSRKDESPYEDSSKSIFDNDRFYTNVAVDLRRWNRINNRASWYWGGRLGGAYTYDEDKKTYTESYSENTRREKSVALSFITGADLKLLDHLSGSISFIPFATRYMWATRDGISMYEADGDREEYRSTSTEDYDTFSIEVSFQAAAYFSLTF